MLGYAPDLSISYLGAPDGVQKGRFTMVHMTKDRNHRRAGFKVGLVD